MECDGRCNMLRVLTKIRAQMFNFSTARACIVPPCCCNGRLRILDVTLELTSLSCGGREIHNTPINHDSISLELLSSPH